MNTLTITCGDAQGGPSLTAAFELDQDPEDFDDEQIGKFRVAGEQAFRFVHGRYPAAVIVTVS